MAQRQRKEKRTRLKTRLRTFWAKVIGLPFIGILGLYFAYKTTGSDSLRSEIYQPLYEEVGIMEQALQANVLEQVTPSQIYTGMEKTGKLERIPKSLRAELREAYAKSGASSGHLPEVLHRIEILAPEQVKRIRNADDDTVWTQKTVEQLNREVDLRGLGGIYARFQFQHTGHSLAIDQRDPAHPKVASPAGVTWNVNDWVAYPKSVDDVDKSWNRNSYLEFHTRSGAWFYRITQEDLERNHLSLRQFLQPIYFQLAGDRDFQQLASGEKEALELIKNLKQKLAERVDSPKKLSDLVWFLN